jgi:hypothetical protein
MATWLPPTVLMGAALLAGVLADRLAALLTVDRGVFWTRTLLYSTLAFAVVLFDAWVLELLDAERWRLGTHVMLDLSGRGSMDWESTYWIALALPGALWLLALAAAYLPRDTEPFEARWLAGSIGMKDSRAWVLWVPVPALALLLGFSFGDLGSGGDAYPAALWSALALSLLTLIGVAASKDRNAPAPKPRPASPRAPVLEPWPEAVAREGIAVQTLHVYLPGEPPRSVEGEEARALAQRWPHLAARRVAPELIEAVAAVAGEGQGGRSDACNRLVLAPDDCGQAESAALAADQMRRRFQACTLVLVPQRPAVLAERLAEWLPAEGAIDILRPDAEPEAGAFVWVADVELLSNRLIPMLEQEPALLERIGLVLWWDLHRYSGVMAANFWAISHRFHRLIRRKGRGNLRHLAFVRASPGLDAKYTRFLAQSLPQKFPPESQVVVPARLARKLAVHLLDPDPAARVVAIAGDRPPLTDPVLAAARASVGAGWATCLDLPGYLDAGEAGAFFQQTVHGRPLKVRLQSDAATAGARVIEVGTADVLALLQVLSSGGRAADGEPSLQHAGLTVAFGNPYVRWLLERLRDHPDELFERSRRLVAVPPQPGVIQRHLLLALNELPAVTSGLLDTFQWEAGEIDKVLRRLAADNLIRRRDVRYLDGAGVLKPEIEYHSNVTRDRAPPLDTVGTRLVPVIDPAGGDGNALLRSLDPERLTIEAYPARAFVHDGRRYRVSDWKSVDAIAAREAGIGIRCAREQAPVMTWRIFEPHIADIRPLPGRQRVDFGLLPLSRTAVILTYREDIRGHLEYERNPSDGRWEQRQGGQYQPIASRPFETRALLLEIAAERLRAFSLGLHSLAQAMRHVFPVHVGVDEDAVAVVPVSGQPVGGRIVWGLMLVDLYPGGIGLIDAIEDDQTLIERLLRRTRDWLAACPCASDRGCASCLQSPLALSATADPLSLPLSRGEALGILEEVLN